ncbi:glucokinase [Lichenihabitans sp. Uapishka_5]|uniref:glucokinase n=1 Tax=Lichenihabitans sp. Uapishka_5 TaxID=3037302 RepID=UPI0029E8268C|nr:glucokinase [Lichenihabitans sp. Uapishka_5]MDX7951423.1 glucokinase [Lichenihabitans sp. Uapishka_5]
MFPYPVVVCDVGGTNCRIAGQAIPGGPLLSLGSLKTADFAGLAPAIRSVTSDSFRPRSVIACGAGPVEDGRVLKLTNAPWIMDGPQIARDLGLAAGLLLNDFEAQALSLPALRPEWLHPIGSPVGSVGGVRVILGPGTGLGIGGLIEAGGRLVPLASEACHIGFAPEADDEVRLWPHLERAHGRITTESVLSGAGLERLHRARLVSDGKAPQDMTAAEITNAALADRASVAAGTVALYWRLIGRFAGDMAVTFKATGGVTLAGGILPRVVDLLDPLAFRAAFEAKAPVGRLAESIPTQLIVHSDSVLGGMAAIAEVPDRYALDYKLTAWA